QHGRFEKHCCYEPAVRAPLVIRLPGAAQAGRHSDALVEFIDIVPTILDRCGLATPATVQGRSLAAVLNGETEKHREHVIVEYSENEEAMIRDNRYKLVYITGRRQREDGYATARPLDHRAIELFDEQSDPGELVNLADKPEQASRIDAFLHELADHLRRTARRADLVPPSDDLYTFIDGCLVPHDVQ
ncbi:MAG TPA: sulfatase/phosphatase domain-containing protein, partial [Pirellulales bacterium]|nr:sulfatase/phosphatase domain-containing protein [Pirellulales bacterium]